MATKELFDKKFVIAAILIAVAYVAIVVLIGALLGKDAAGVSGIALTALATGLFRKFETLRFRKISEEKSKFVEVPPVNIWRVIISAFAFIGAEY
jgi:hypothetical protein